VILGYRFLWARLCRCVPFTEPRPKEAVFLVFTLLLALPLFGQTDQRWKIQYFFDKSDSGLDLRDIQCPTTLRCVAAGVIEDKKGHEDGVVVITNDGGKQWTKLDVKERPQSLFFLNESLGWMVTDKGVWSTEESGRSWKKLEGLKGILRVHFLNPSHGYAIGFPKAAYETTDGGKKWTKLAAAENVSTIAKETVFNCIAFLGDHGIIIGAEIPPQYERSPIWADPLGGRYRRERSKTAIVIETLDGGKTWNSNTTSIVGSPVKLQLHPGKYAILLVQYQNYYDVPSSIVRIDLGGKTPRTLLGEHDRAITDVTVFADGTGMVAAIEPPGNSNQVPIPGKLHVLRSEALKLWTEMDVDYKAIAQRAILAAPDHQHAWIATDTGMILSLVDNPKPSR
jgi:hypothetical protein